MNFKSWLLEKKGKESDLVFISSLKQTQHIDLFYRLADQVSVLQPSYSEGLQVFELLTDLILMGFGDDELIPNQTITTDYKAHLKKLRYPMTTEKDANLKQNLETLPWPQGSKIKFERRGDRAGVELKLFISSKVDLTKILSALERVQNEFK